MDMQKAAQEFAGNWQQWRYFIWDYRHDEHADQWGIWYTNNVSAGLIEESNQAQIEATFKAHHSDTENEMWRIEGHKHDVCGWLDCISVRVYGDDGAISPEFMTLCDIRNRLEAYPILNEDDYSQREYDATLANIESELRLAGIETNVQPADIFSWLWEHHQSSVESRDDRGGYPDGEAIQEAVDALTE